MISRDSAAEKTALFLRKKYGRDIEKGIPENPFKVLISCVLSQRTREENTAVASKSLFSVASTPDKISEMPLAELQKLIKAAGLARQKAKNILQISKAISANGGVVPSAREALMNLPGVGPKTADITLCYGFGIPCIPVDVHVNRISRRIGLVDGSARIEEVGGLLQNIFDKKDWRIVNRGLVLFGREICLPRNPKCGICELNYFCKFGQQTLKKRA